MKLSRNERLAKLGNAIREWRGVTQQTPRGVKWKRAPKRQKVERILVWLASLGVPEPILALDDIASFKTFDEMQAWLRKLDAETKERHNAT